jgi:putative ABC transport system permease protein
MLGTRWYKVISDLWSHRTRTLIVALAVAVGVYAVGTVLAAQVLMLREFHRDRDSTLIASAILYTYPFDEEFAARVAEMPGIEAAEGRETLSARIVTGPTAWRNLDIMSVADFENMQVDRYPLVAGRWPAARDEIMLEWMGMDYIGAQIGDRITIELPDNTRKELTISGTMHNPQRPSPAVMGFTFALVSPATMVYLGQPHLFTELHVRVAGAEPGAPGNREHVAAVMAGVEDRVERSGREVLNTTIIGRSIIESIVNTAVMIISMFGWVILLLSGFLVINTISALIAQQINQIGIMKLIGASRLQMVAMYVTLVLVYGTMAFSIGIPLAITTARFLMTDLVEGMVNIRSDSYAIPLWVYAVMVAIGVLIPLIAGLIPVWQGTRISTYRALNDNGIQSDAAGHSPVERLLARLPKTWLQRPLLLAVRNTLRHKGRLLRTMIVLILGTALFIAVVSVRQSVDTTQADFLRYHQYDVEVQFEEAHRIGRLETAAFALSDVAAVEGWGVSGATRLRPDGSESNSYQVLGVPPASPLLNPIVQAGRWLLPGDEDAVVINATVAKDETDLAVGDTIVLDMEGRERSWEVVGIVTSDAQGPKVFMPYETFGHANRNLGKANRLLVTANQNDALAQEALESILLNHFEAKGFDVRSTMTTHKLNDQNGLMFNIIVGYLILNAVLLGAVGSLGLSTTMGINMMERIREIGVLRAIGASNGAIRRIVLLEGIVIACLSWVVGFVLSFPIAQWMSAQIGVALLDMPLSYTYSWWAAGVWFVALLALAVAASLGPARNAVRLTIREVLAYE